jgi:ferredoxin
MQDGKAEFLRGNDCLRCVRCIGICPVNAILFGEGSQGKGRYTSAFRDKLFQEARKDPVQKLRSECPSCLTASG